MLEMRPKIVGDTCVEGEIGAAPDQLDRNIKGFHSGKALDVPGGLFENLRRHLREGRTGTGLSTGIEIIVYD